LAAPEALAHDVEGAMSTPNPRRRGGRVTGHLITIPRKSGDRRAIKFRDRDGRQGKHIIGLVGELTAKQEADALRDFLTDLGREPEGAADHVRLDDAIAAFLRYIEHDRDRADSTVADYRRTLNHRVIGHVGADMPIASITTDDVDDLRRELLDKVSRRTAQKTLAILHGLLAFAKRRRWASLNAATDAEKVQVRRPVQFAVLDPDEVFAVADKADDDTLRALIIVAAFTGLRMGELRALQWRDVDFTNALVHVRRNLPRGKPGDPKSHQARSVPLMDDAARELDHLSRRPRYTEPQDRVFCQWDGSRLDDGYMPNGLYDAMTAAKIDRDRGTGKLFVFHDLRHTFGTMAVRVFPLTDVKAYMGHADIATTMLYVHHTPQHDAAAKLTALARGSGTRGYPVGTQTTASGVPERTSDDENVA
jgi:integrase